MGILTAFVDAVRKFYRHNVRSQDLHTHNLSKYNSDWSSITVSETQKKQN